MILTGQQIIIEVEKGTITIDPFSVANINPNSYNYRVGTHIKESLGSNKFSEISIPKAGILLKPNTLYLANTKEIIGSELFSTNLIGRSSLGRLGLFCSTQQT